MRFSSGSSQTKNGTLVSYVSCIDRQVLHHWCHLGSPLPHLEERKHSKFLLQTLIPGYHIPPALLAMALCPPCSNPNHSVPVPEDGNTHQIWGKGVSLAEL